MTRINLINVEELTDQHLLAEHREIKRIPNVISKGKYSLKWMPETYTMWTGHVKFFYDKIEWLHNRYIAIYNECLSRWFNVENYEQSFLIYWPLYNDYVPTEEAKLISLKRIKEKLDSKKSFYRLRGVLIIN